jgi:hypothetical protein
MNYRKKGNDFLIISFNRKNPDFKKPLKYHKEILYALSTKNKVNLKNYFPRIVGF